MPWATTSPAAPSPTRWQKNVSPNRVLRSTLRPAKLIASYHSVVALVPAHVSRAVLVGSNESTATVRGSMTRLSWLCAVLFVFGESPAQAQVDLVPEMRNFFIRTQTFTSSSGDVLDECI